MKVGSVILSLVLLVFIVFAAFGYLFSQHQNLNMELQRTRSQYNGLVAENAMLESKVTQLQAENNQLQAEVTGLRAEINRVRDESAVACRSLLEAAQHHSPTTSASTSIQQRQASIRLPVLFTGSRLTVGLSLASLLLVGVVFAGVYLLNNEGSHQRRHRNQRASNRIINRERKQ